MVEQRVTLLIMMEIQLLLNLLIQFVTFQHGLEAERAERIERLESRVKIIGGKKSFFWADF
jgi:hypothetical protein